MINFRYHVVSLVAIFLSLGIGVLVGSSFIDRGTVAVLRATQQRLADTNGELRDQVVVLERESETLKNYAGLLKPLVVRDRLRNRPAIVVAFDDTPEDVERAATETLIQAGAEIQASIEVSSKIDMANDARRQQVALALESDSAEREVLRDLLIERLVAGISVREDAFIQRLVDTELAQVEGAPGQQARPASEIGGPESLVVVLGLGTEGSEALEEEFIVPFVRSLAVSGVILAVGDVGTEESSLLRPLRLDPGLRAVTIDGIEKIPGQTALVLGLEAAIGGTYGHYGTGRGAATLLPEVRGPAAPRQ